jgi:hypothetical protein
MLRYNFDYFARTTRRKNFDYFNIVDYGVNCGLPRSGAHRRHALAQTIDNARGLDINSP